MAQAVRKPAEMVDSHPANYFRVPLIDRSVFDDHHMPARYIFPKK